MRQSYRVAAWGAGLAAAALLVAGCGYGGVASAGAPPDTGNGQKLFAVTCGGCHTLSAAGTSGTIGPNLDNAFAGDRQQGYPDSTIENVVLDQIRLGSGPILKPYTSQKYVTEHCQNPKKTTSQCTTQAMPANLLTGQNAKDVAAYVASVAGTAGYTTVVNLAALGNDGAAIFKKGPCAGCHTLAAAGTTGTIGPNLDQLASALTVAIVVRQVTNGGVTMPAFKGTLTTSQIQAVAQYVTSVAGKKK